MLIENVPFMTTNWAEVPEKIYPGETGQAIWKTLEIGNIRVRMVTYSAGYKADHWCSRGHVILVMEGELITELEDGRIFKLTPGMTYQVASNKEPHRSSTVGQVKIFIVD